MTEESRQDRRRNKPGAPGREEPRARERSGRDEKRRGDEDSAETAGGKHFDDASRGDRSENDQRDASRGENDQDEASRDEVDAQLDEELEESFPASDPPSLTQDQK